VRVACKGGLSTPAKNSHSTRQISQYAVYPFSLQFWLEDLTEAVCIARLIC